MTRGNVVATHLRADMVLMLVMRQLQVAEVRISMDEIEALAAMPQADLPLAFSYTDAHDLVVRTGTEREVQRFLQFVAEPASGRA